MIIVFGVVMFIGNMLGFSFILFVLGNIFGIFVVFMIVNIVL